MREPLKIRIFTRNESMQKIPQAYLAFSKDRILSAKLSEKPIFRGSYKYGVMTVSLHTH